MKTPIHRILPTLFIASGAVSLLPSCAVTAAQNEPPSPIVNSKIAPAQAASIPAAQPATMPKVPHAMWVWDATVITNAQQQKALFDFCARKGISVIYQSVGDIFSANQLAPGAPKHVTAPMLAEFLQAAHARKLQVEALDGDPTFALTEHHAEALGILQKALNYNKAAAPGARLDGFQWDTEPYILPAFSQGAEQKKAIFEQYLDSMKEMRDAVQQSPNLRLSFCIPWFFSVAENTINWNGSDEVPSSHLLDLLQSLPAGEMVLMSYRDKALGTNGTIEISRGEVEYAEKRAPKVKVWIGQETLDVKGDPPSITFFQEGESALNQATGQIGDAYAKNPAFGGVAIHHWESYRELKPGDPIVEAPAPAPSDTLKVLAPSDNAKVARETFVSGVAPTGGKGVKVSLAVKPEGDTWYDQGEAPVAANGSWSVRALFGGENTPAGSAFQARARLLAADGSVVEEQIVSGLTRTNDAAP